MGIVKIRAYAPVIDPCMTDGYYTFTAVGDSKHIKEITSDAPEPILDYFKNRVETETFVLQPAMYYPDPGTMLNFISIMKHFYFYNPDKIEVEVFGDIGTVPNRKGVTY